MKVRVWLLNKITTLVVPSCELGPGFNESYQTFHQFLKIFFFQSLCYVKLFRLVHLTMYFMQLQMSECCIHLSINHRFNQYNVFCVVFFFIALSSLLQWASIQSSEVTGRRLILCHGSIPYHGRWFCVLIKLFLYFGRRLILYHGRIFILYHGMRIILCHGRRLIPYHGRRFWWFA